MKIIIFKFYEKIKKQFSLLSDESSSSFEQKCLLIFKFVKHKNVNNKVRNKLITK